MRPTHLLLTGTLAATLAATVACEMQQGDATAQRLGQWQQSQNTHDQRARQAAADQPTAATAGPAAMLDKNNDQMPGGNALTGLMAQPIDTPGLTAEPGIAADFDPQQPVAAAPAAPASPAPVPVADPGVAVTYQAPDRVGPGVTGLSLYGETPAVPAGRSAAMDSNDGLRQVTFGAEGADFDIAPTPDGEALVFASTRHRDTSDLYLQRNGGRAITQLTNDPANDAMPAVSPDGTRIAFCSDRAGDWNLYVMDITGGQAVQLTAAPTQDIHPSWSPDGSRIVYSSYGASSGQWEMVLIDVDNPAARTFIGHGLFPSFSPTEDRIVFQRARQRGTRWFSVWTVDLVNNEATSPTEVAASSNAAVITPEWSRDGQYLVFCTVMQDGQDQPVRPRQADLWVMRADGTGRARLTNGQFANLQPAWSGDGSIYFVSDRGVGGVENVWSVRADEAVRVAQQNRAVPTRPGQESATAAVPTP
jgi:Tol biopolymer transport system component